MIRMDDLSKNYGDLAAVSMLNLHVKAGEIFAFLGPNGAGKTTTIKMLNGLIRPSSGSIAIGGHDVESEGEKAKALVGYVADQPFVYEKLSPREFFRFVGGLYGLDETVTEERSLPYMELFGLVDRMDRLLEGFSHGMRQKVSMTAALLHRPQVLVVDEPMVGLDPKSILLVKDLFRRLSAEGATVFLSTHTLEVAETVCSSIGIIHRGHLVARGTMDELRELAARPGSNLEEVFLRLTEEA